MLDDDTAINYRGQYINLGTESLLNESNNGTVARLNTDELKKLAHHLEENTRISTKVIIVWIKDCFELAYSKNGINSLLKILGFIYKKPVLTTCKANVKKQEEFIAEYKEKLIS